MAQNFVKWRSEMLGNIVTWLMFTLLMSGLSAYLYPELKKAGDIKTKRDLNRSFAQRFLRRIPISALLSLVLVGMKQFGMFGTTKFDRFLDGFFEPYRPRMWICLVIIGIGVGAHRWKLKSKFGYGIGEVVFGCFATIF